MDNYDSYIHLKTAAMLENPFEANPICNECNEKLERIDEGHERIAIYFCPSCEKLCYVVATIGSRFMQQVDYSEDSVKLIHESYGDKINTLRKYQTKW